MNKDNFKYVLMANMEAVREQIQSCEGRHVQQAIFSTYMDTLTQVCFTCQRVRSTIDWNGSQSWSMNVYGKSKVTDEVIPVSAIQEDDNNRKEGE